MNGNNKMFDPFDGDEVYEETEGVEPGFAVSWMDKDKNENEDNGLDELKLGFVRLLGKDVSEYYNYELVMTNNINDFWGEGFEYKPAGLSNSLSPDEKYVDKVIRFKSFIKLDLIQDSGSFSMQDAMDGIVAIAWENLDEAEVYPEEGRLVLQFGEDYDVLERKLAMKHILINED